MKEKNTILYYHKKKKESISLVLLLGPRGRTFKMKFFQEKKNKHKSVSKKNPTTNSHTEQGGMREISETGQLEHPL